MKTWTLPGACRRPYGSALRSLRHYHSEATMSDRERRGMLIKNNGTETVRVSMSSRLLRLDPGEEKFITPDEVQDPMLREALQERSISIVRPATPAEDEALRERLDEE